MVLLEAVISIPLLAVIAVCLAWALSLAATSIALGDAAREAAREIARGVDPASASTAAAAHVAGSSVRVDDAGEFVEVVAARAVSIPVPVLSGITVDVTQRVAVPREWS